MDGIDEIDEIDLGLANGTAGFEINDQSCYCYHLERIEYFSFAISC